MPVQFGIGERDTANRLPQHIGRSRSSIATEIETGRRTDERVSPSIENDPGHAGTRVKPATTKEAHQLLANLAFVVAIRRGKDLVAAGGCLLANTALLRPLERDIKRQHRRLVRMQLRT